LQAIRGGGVAAGLALCPATPVEMYADVLEEIDLALCMSVNPGWGNQQLIPHSYAKLTRMRELLPVGVGIEVDGGVHGQTAAACTGAGANLLVAGSAVFGAADPGAAFQALTETAWSVRA